MNKIITLNGKIISINNTIGSLIPIPPPPPPELSFIIDTNALGTDMAAIDFTGNTNKTININWGDNLNDNLIFTGGQDSTTHQYTPDGNKSISITGDLSDIFNVYASLTKIINVNVNSLIGLLYFDVSSNPINNISITNLPVINNLRCTNTGISSININSLPELIYVQLFGNNLSNIDDILINLDMFNLTDGYITTQGGTNAPIQTQQGTTAYNNLIGKNWTVQIN